MYLKVFIFLLQLLAINTFVNTECKTTSSKDPYIIFQSIQNGIILQSNQSNFESITDIGYDILTQDFLIKFEENVEIIQVIKSKNIKMSTVENRKVMFQEVCILSKQQSLTSNNYNYSIDCTFINFSNQKRTHSFNSNTTEQSFQILLDEIEYCSKLLLNQEQLILFCHNEHYFKFYQLNAHNNTSQQYQFLKQQNDCQIKLIQIDNFIFISYLRCKTWIIYSMDQNFNISVYLDYEKKYLQSHYETYNLEDLVNIQSCQNKLFLIFKKGYIVEQIKKRINKTFFAQTFGALLQFVINDNDDVYFLVFRNCHIDSVVISDQIFSFQNTNRVNLGTIPNNVFQMNEIPVIIKGNQLVVILTININQTYNLNFTNINQFQQSNKLYLINQKNKEISFFSLQLQQFLKLNDQYFYEIEIWNIFSSGTIFKCINNSKTESQVNNMNLKLPIIQISNNCSMGKEIFIIKNSKIFEHPYKIQGKEYILQNGTIVMKIFDIFEVTKLCQSKYLQDKNVQLLNINMNTQQLMILVNQKILVVDFNDNQLIKEIDVTGKQVLNNINFIIIYTSDIKLLNIYSWYGSFFPFSNIDGHIEQIKVFTHQLIVKVKNSELIYDTNTKVYINPNSQLNQFNKFSFINSNIKFYYQDQDITLIQYDDFIQIKHQNQNGIFLNNIQNIQLFFIYQHQSGHYFMFGLHEFESILKLYFLSENNLIEMQSIFEDDYIFIRPIQYKYARCLIAILAQQEQTQILLLYKFEQNFLILSQTIKISKSLFFIEDQQLIYYNQNNTLEVLSLDKFYLNIQSKNFIQNRFIEKVSIQVNFPSQSKLELDLQGKLELELINFCFNIYSKIQLMNINNDLRFEKNKKISLKFNPMQQFYGYIQNYHIENDNMKLLGPFIFEIFIRSCRGQKSQQCFSLVKINYKNKTINLYETLINDTHAEFSKIVNEPFPFKLFNSTYLIIIQNEGQLTAIIFEKINKTQNYTIIQELQLHNQNELVNCEEIKIEVQNQLFLVLLDNFLRTIIYFDGEKFMELNTNENILDAVIVQNSEEMYLFLYQKSNTTLQIVVQQIFNNNILLNLYIDKNLFEQDLYFLDADDKNKKIKQYDIISTYLQNFTLDVSFIYFTKNIVRFIQLKINIIDLNFTWIVENSLRIAKDLLYKQYYLLDNHFITQSSDKEFQYYNLSQKQDFYDSVYIFTQNIFLIQRFNSTHFLFKWDGQIAIGRIEFELIINISGETQERGKLIASNELSQASIDIVFDKQIQVGNISVKLIFIIIFSLLIIFFFTFIIRRRKLKSKYHKSITI